MASKIVGIAVLTEPRLIGKDPRLMYLDANFWIADDIQIVACMRYYNDIGFSFKPVTTCVIEATVSGLWYSLTHSN